jgi:glycosyltransferase involved in cell wall biosynthesis
MKIMVLPRDPNPYQRLLYGEMQQLGVKVRYIGALTASRTLNLLLLPLETAAGRAGGARLVHLHWVFTFTFPGYRRLPLVRRVGYLWFLLWLRTCRALGVHLVWTSHNVLPHRSVFADDVAARRSLVQASDLVLAHSQSALAELAALGATVRRNAVIQHGPIAPTSSVASLRSPGADGKPYRFLFLGSVQEYKGVEDLLAAFLAMPRDVSAHLTVTGQCDDPALRSRLRVLARDDTRVALQLERVPDEEMAHVLAAADIVVLPFRRITTSGSAILALSCGRPLLIPDLAGLADLPNAAVFRYHGGVGALTAALTRLAAAPSEMLAAMSAAAIDYTATITWREIAESTLTEMRSVLGDIRIPDDRRTTQGAQCQKSQ